jgi:hypothetical protein
LHQQRKKQLKDLLRKIKSASEQNTRAIMAVAQAERSLKDKLKLKETTRE